MKYELQCPICGGKVIEVAKGFSCENWPIYKKNCKFTIWKESYGAIFTEDDAKALLSGEQVEKTNISKAGLPYKAYWYMPTDKIKPVFERVEESI